MRRGVAFPASRRVANRAKHIGLSRPPRIRASPIRAPFKGAQDLIDTVIDQRSGRDPKMTLFEKWEAPTSENARR